MNEIEKGGPAFPTVMIDKPEGGMTLRQYAAIKLKVPDSGTEWLDEMIAQSARDEFAAKAMQGICSSALLNVDVGATAIANNAYEIADAMLNERNLL